jgi:membrane-bound serine protease (ClpP class)
VLTHPPARRCTRPSRVYPRSRPFIARTPNLFIILATLLGFGGVHAAIAAQTVDAEAPVYVVSITGAIDLGLAPYLKRVIDEATEAGAPAVILEIDTPGGRLDAVLQMQDSLLDAGVRTIAFVNRTAFSAGALIAIAAEEIYMVPGAVMGAATPVDGAGETASAKIVSAVRKTFKTTAEVRGRDPLVAEAMVDPDVVIDGLVARGELLTLTTSEAMTWGYADGIVADRGELLHAAGLAGVPLKETSPRPAERLVRFVTDPVVASLMIAAAILLIIGDFFVGGFGVVGGVGLLLLATFFWGHMLAGLAGWEDIALVALGLVLLGVEVFVVPGFGVPGLLGLAALAVGFWLAMVGREIRTPEATERAGWSVAAALLAVIVGTVALLAFLPHLGRAGGLVLQAQVGHGAPVAARPSSGWLRWFGGGPGLRLPAAQTPQVGRPAQVRPLTGASGVALSDLRPSGTADIQGRQVDVVTTGEYITAGEAITVVTDEGYRRVVRRVTRAAD